MELEEIQKRAYDNKLKHNFNVTDLNLEFCLMYGEVAEAYEAWLKKHDNVGEELADIALYLVGIAEILGISLHDEIVKKLEINEKREYVIVNGIPVKKGSADDINA